MTKCMCGHPFEEQTKMPRKKDRIVEQCVHGKRTIGECRACKLVYYQRFKSDTPHWLWSAAKSRARINRLPFTITPDDVKVSTHCPVLGIPLDSRTRDYTPSLDAVVPELGYVPHNVVVISGRANRIKRQSLAVTKAFLTNERSAQR